MVVMMMRIKQILEQDHTLLYTRRAGRCPVMSDDLDHSKPAHALLARASQIPVPGPTFMLIRVVSDFQIYVERRVGLPRPTQAVD